MGVEGSGIGVHHAPKVKKRNTGGGDQAGSRRSSSCRGEAKKNEAGAGGRGLRGGRKASETNRLPGEELVATAKRARVGRGSQKNGGKQGKKRMNPQPAQVPGGGGELQKGKGLEKGSPP